MTKQDTYEFYPTHAICHSKSGNTYLVMYDPLSCNCKGFGYYQYCRHSTYVTEHSMICNICGKKMRDYKSEPFGLDSDCGGNCWECQERIEGTDSIKSDDNPPVNGNPTVINTTVQDNIMHQLIHGNRKD